jgi:ATP-dependent exoDNAse (exonuclease V) alpha subunit
MTINKSQKQTFEKIGILLSQTVFARGQFYVAASRVRSFNGLRFYIYEYNGQGHLANDKRVFTKN